MTSSFLHNENLNMSIRYLANTEMYEAEVWCRKLIYDAVFDYGIEIGNQPTDPIEFDDDIILKTMKI